MVDGQQGRLFYKQSKLEAFILNLNNCSVAPQVVRANWCMQGRGDHHPKNPLVRYAPPLMMGYTRTAAELLRYAPFARNL